MTENQKLREALLSDMDIAVLRMPVHLAFAGNMAQFQYHNRVQALLDRIEALATPTAEQVDDINVAESFTSVTKTDAPDIPLSMNQFGRLVELTREHLTDNTFVYKATSKAGDTCHFGVESAAKAWAKGGTVEAIKVREFKLHTSALTAAPVVERDALDAARYRWLADCNSYPEAVTLISDGSLTADALGKAIDAAMRKGQL